MNIKPNYWHRAFLTSILLNVLLCAVTLAKDTLPLAPSDEKNYAEVSALVAYFLEKQHFAQQEIDNSITKEWLDNYMADLDPNRMFFHSSDQEEFSKKFLNPITKAIDTKIETPFSFFGNKPAIVPSDDFAQIVIHPAFVIFERFKSRVGERVSWVSERLNEDFDFTQDEYYEFDRSEADWPTSETEALTLWNKRLKYEILQFQLSDFLNDTEDNSVSSDLDETAIEDLDPENFEVTSDTLDKVRKRYQRIEKYSNGTDSEDVVEIYLSALTKVYDPHSQYLSPKTLEDFRIMMKQKLVGIGAILSIDPRNGYCTIREIMPGGPADLDGRLRVNDRIVGVAQGPSELVDVFDMKLRDTVRLIRGKLGSQVRLEIIPADADDTSTRQLVELTRNEISVTLQKAKARHITIPASEGAKEMKLGVIELPSFYGDDDGNSTTADVYALLQELLDVGIDGLVLDLRSNGGGLLNEAIRLTGLFIDRGPVVQVKNSLGRRTTYEDIEPDAAYKGPLVVLTNKLSASASEIVAGALQDYARAIVIGDKSTHGKGTVQTVAQLGEYLKRAQEEAASAGAMKLTVQQFYLPDGESTQGRGVIPDIIFPSVNDYLEIGEDTLPHSLPWDEISSTEFEPCQDGLSQIIPSLLSRSLARVQENEDFSLLLEDISNLRERLETKQESLNIAQRLSEKKKRDELSDLKDARSDAKYDHLPDLISITFNEDGNLERNVESKTKPTDEDKDSTKPNFTVSYTRDPYLQETLNILTDLVLIESNQLSLDQVALSKKVNQDS